MSELRDALTAAFEASGESTHAEAAPLVPEDTGGDDGGAGQVVEDTASASTGGEDTSNASVSSAVQRARDEAGRFAKGKAAATATPPPEVTKPDAAKAPTQGEATGTEAPAAQTPSATPAPQVKPPQAWTPAAREKWAAVPPEVQAEVARREREIATTLNETAPARKFFQDFQQAAQPLSARGVDPVASFRNFVHVDTVLATGSPQAKAQLIARVIQAARVPIDALDAELSGQPMPGGQPGAPAPVDPATLASQVDARVMQTLQQYQQQVRRQQAEASMSAFAEKAEFLEDVRDDMADMLELAHRRGKTLSLEEAYNRACKLHPEVSAKLSQREALETAKAREASTQQRRAAASSVRSQPAAASPAAQPDSVRGSLEASIRALSGQ